jgi:FKBP-type peptidyl-prolyl cis-trans isomerase
VKQSIIAVALAAAVFLSLSGCSSDKKVTALTTQDQKVSYMFGLNMGGYLKKLDIKVDRAALIQGITDTLSGSKPLLTSEQVMALQQEFSKTMQEKQMAEMKALSEKNGKEGSEFLAKNKNEKGVVTTASGLQYTILKQGTGPKPVSTDVVSVNYRGMFIDGKEFDNSYTRGQPATFPVTGVIPGWTEALQLMQVGTKAKLFVPGNLGYGERGMGQQIPPNKTLLFEVELLSIQPKMAAAPSGATPAGAQKKIK